MGLSRFFWNRLIGILGLVLFYPLFKVVYVKMYSFTNFYKGQATCPYQLPDTPDTPTKIFSGLFDSEESLFDIIIGNFF